MFTNTTPETKPGRGKQAETAEDLKRKRDLRQAKWRERHNRMAEAGREIGPLPPVKNPRRRSQCEKDLQRALKIYFPRRFPLPFSRDHVRVIESIELAAREGMLLAFAMPRGTGKTTICETASLLVVLFGWHSYVALLAATSQHAKKRIEGIKTELRHNPKLLADFPEAVYPIRQLSNITQRARGQKLNGKSTDIGWHAERIIFPSIDGSPSSGACLECAGLLGAVRGMNYTSQDGDVKRPSFALIDDPQTRRSAKSETQTLERERIIQSEILYLPGPGKRISAVMPATIIEPGDLADRILDREKNPEWRGIKTSLVYTMPTSTKWDDYAQIRHEELTNGGTGKKAKAYYKKNRAEMDKGAEVAWPEQVDAGDLSALQSAMNKFYRDRLAFFAEMQNDPGAAHRDSQPDQLRAPAIAEKTSHLKRGESPPETLATTAFVDVQKEVLFFVVVAWRENMTGHLIDYGTWPKQPGHYFTLANLRKTLSKTYPNRALEGRLRQGLEDLADNLASTYEINRGLVDAAWGVSRDTVYEFCTAHASRWWPSHGRYIGPGRKPMRDWTSGPGDLPTRLARRTQAEAAHWRSPKPDYKTVRHVLIDVNYWKSYLMRRLQTGIGDKGCLSLFQTSGKANHQLFAAHLTAESRVETSGPFGTVDDWRLNPGSGGENHWFDCTVGALVAANVAGLALDTTAAPVQRTTRKRQRVKYL